MKLHIFQEIITIEAIEKGDFELPSTACGRPLVCIVRRKLYFVWCSAFLTQESFLFRL